MWIAGCVAADQLSSGWDFLGSPRGHMDGWSQRCCDRWGPPGKYKKRKHCYFSKVCSCNCHGLKASALNSPALVFFFLAAETVVCLGLTQGGELGREPEHRERAATRNSSRERRRNLNKQFQPLRIYSQPHLLHDLLLKSLPKNEKKNKKMLS